MSDQSQTYEQELKRLHTELTRSELHCAELLEVLREVERVENVWQEMTGALSPTLKQVREAIAKAEGQ